MPLFALDPTLNDFLTVGGFLVGVLGLGYTIKQVRETRRAAEAARDAAEKTLAENKEAFERFVAAHAGRFLSELRIAAQRGEWTVAEARAHDLADILAGLPGGTIPVVDAADVVDRLRQFGQVFAELIVGKRKKLPAPQAADQWRPLLRLVDAQLDLLRMPFRRETPHDARSADPRRDVPPDRPGSGREDEGGAGDVGQAPP